MLLIHSSLQLQYHIPNSRSQRFGQPSCLYPFFLKDIKTRAHHACGIAWWSCLKPSVVAPQRVLEWSDKILYHMVQPNTLLLSWSACGHMPTPVAEEAMTECVEWFP